eukprot:gene13133-biopygen520
MASRGHSDFVDGTAGVDEESRVVVRDAPNIKGTPLRRLRYGQKVWPREQQDMGESGWIQLHEGGWVPVCPTIEELHHHEESFIAVKREGQDDFGIEEGQSLVIKRPSQMDGPWVDRRPTWRPATGEQFMRCPLRSSHDWRTTPMEGGGSRWWASDVNQGPNELVRIRAQEIGSLDPAVFSLHKRKQIMIVGDAGGGGHIRVCEARDFFFALVTLTETGVPGVPLCPARGWLGRLRRPDGRLLWDLLEDKQMK